MIHRFPCGTNALDFVGTLRARNEEAPIEALAAPSDLDAWFTEAGMLDGPAGASAADVDVAIELREAIASLAFARIRKTELDADAVELVNSFAAAAPVTVSLADGKLTKTGSVAQGLSDIAREAVTIIGGPDAELLRECSRPGCNQIYLDKSRGHRRDWCSMQTCGNRVKASKFRARHAGAAAAAVDEA